IRDKARQICGDEERLGELISLPFGRELGEMAEAFNLMSVALRKERDELETRIKARTEELAERTDQMQKSLKENQGLLSELQHRAKNSFNMISSMIGMAVSNATSSETRKVVEYLGVRVKSVSELYDLLYSKGSVTEVRLDDYCTRIAGPMIALNGNITLEMELESLTLSVKEAAPIGLILTELVTNVVKYAFPGGKSGTVTIGLKRTADGKALLEVSDDGIGLPAGFDLSADAGMGLNLIQGLAGQIGGVFRMDKGVVGTRGTLEFGIDKK
ncbi:MAG: sensor histidine kinase, partial [Spirochaetota bacterium]